MSPDIDGGAGTMSSVAEKQVHVHSPLTVAVIIVGACPTCEGERGFLRRWADWYGAYDTCLSCGDEWGDGELLPRPFKPRWRAENIRDAGRDGVRSGCMFAEGGGI